ncbi:unnamed protein product [Polarella glacialis]|uniref:Uncharacterized protein n=1 Tax=Polarella glacialis TaxID=89957 RepID=A0A813FMM5_POLGL|nr:unnamed protein product [Polarella glacialis]
MTWSSALLGAVKDAATATVESEGECKLEGLGTQNCADLLWACGRLGSSASHLKRLEDRLQSAVDRLAGLLLDITMTTTPTTTTAATATATAIPTTPTTTTLATTATATTATATASSPSGCLEWASSPYGRAVRELQLVNLRSMASRRLLDAVGVGRASGDFGLRAVARIRSCTERGEQPPGPLGAGVDTTEVFAYVEYDAVLAAAPAAGEDFGSHVDGQLLWESGTQGGRQQAHFMTAGAFTWLEPLRLPNSGHVDRSRCAEFQALSELCAVLAPRAQQPGPQEVVGVVSLFTTISPCLSCLGAIRQFQLFFPEVALELCELEDVDMSRIGAGDTVSSLTGNIENL